MSEENGATKRGAEDDTGTAPVGEGAEPIDGWAGEPSLIDFPATLDVKAMGLNEPDFEPLVCALVLPHVPEATLEAVTTRSSSGGKYLSVRVRFTASSKSQLEVIYRGLRAEPRVLFTL